MKIIHNKLEQMDNGVTSVGYYLLLGIIGIKKWAFMPLSLIFKMCQEIQPSSVRKIYLTNYKTLTNLVLAEIIFSDFSYRANIIFTKNSAENLQRGTNARIDISNESNFSLQVSAPNVCFHLLDYLKVTQSLIYNCSIQWTSIELLIKHQVYIKNNSLLLKNSV